MKNLYCLIAIIGLCMIFTAPLAFCQDLNGKWFKMTFSGKGYLEGEWYAVGSKASAKVVNYAQFVYNTAWSDACPAGSDPTFYPFYEIHMWYPTDSGWDYDVWQGYNTLVPGTYGFYGSPYHETLFLDKQFVLHAGYWNWLPFQGRDMWADATTIIDIKRKNGAISSATFNSVTCASEFETPDGYAYGSCTLKGKLIKTEDLPEGIPGAGAGPLYTTVDPCIK